jgi:hypothetical protein
VSFYGLGQRFLHFPSIESINPAYADGRILYLQAWDRINSTFGGHFDLAAYITFSLPIVAGFYFFKFKNNIRALMLGLFVLALAALQYTSMRSAFGGYLVSITLFLLIHKKFKEFIAVAVITVLVIFATGRVMIKRFSETITTNTSVVNTQTNSTTIIQNPNNPQNLPAGGPAIQIPGLGGSKPVKPSTTKDLTAIKVTAHNQAEEEFKKGGKTPTKEEIDKRADEIAKNLQLQKGLHFDISSSVRLFHEWPHAIALFLKNPVFGGGPSSNTEATDNDILRSLAEVGLVGSALFAWIIFSICRLVYKAMKLVPKEDRMIYSGFIFGVIALIINATYVDVFEASKLAYNFWMVAGFYVGAACLIINTSSKNGKREKPSPHKVHTS